MSPRDRAAVPTAELDIRVIADPQRLAEAERLLGELFADVRRRRGPFRSDKHPGRLLVYLDARLPRPGRG